MLENTKLKMIEVAIKTGQINHNSVMRTFPQGAVNDINKYVKKHGKLPTLDELMEDYRNNQKYIDLMASINISLLDIEDAFKKALPIEGNKIINNTLQAKTDSMKNLYHGIGRNDKCPCGSNLKFKKCCGK